MRHEEDLEPPRTREPRGPFDWAKDVYLRDINVSRRTGWKGKVHDAVVAPFVRGDKFLPKTPKGRGAPFTPMTSEAVQYVLERTAAGIYAPRDAKGDTGVTGRGGPLERPYEALWPPVRNRTLPGVYPPPDPIGPGVDERVYQMYWTEMALAETMVPTGLPRLSWPSYGNDPLRSGVPEVNASPATGFAGGGYVMDMSERFNMVRDLISPTQSGSGGIPPFRKQDPNL